MILAVPRLLRLSLAITLLIFGPLFAVAPVALRQSSVSTADSLLPGPRPPDVPLDWKQIAGIYKAGKEAIVIFERNGKLFYAVAGAIELPLKKDQAGRYFISSKEGDHGQVWFERSISGQVTALSLNKVLMPRSDAGSDPAHFYHVSPVQPISELREAALKLSPPVETGPFRKPDLVELATVDPVIHLDIRYASAKNFLSTPVYTQARAFMQRPAAEALLRVLHKLQPLGYGLLIHDAYRPWYVTKIFWDATPAEGKIFVADPEKGSKHNRGCAVDLTLYDLTTGEAVEMAGLYDEMSPRSFPNFPGGTSLQRWHRDLLRRAMESEGFTVNEDEWWHFDYKDWKQYGILNVPFEKIAGGSE